MGEEVRDIIMSHIRRDVMGNTLSKGIRFDGRAFNQMRPVTIQKGVIRTAEGSAIATVGDTTVLVANKFDVLKPFADRPKEGVLMTNAELLPAASARFEPGPPNEDSIEMARVVDRAVRSAECVDVKSFFIEDDKVLALFMDIYVMNDAGNFTDAASIAAAAALMDTKVPKVENAKIIRGEYERDLNPTSLPVTTSMIKVGNSWLLDPSREEERVLETKMTIGTTDEHVCAMQKAKGSLTRDELLDCIDIAFKTGNDIRELLKRY
jgi:exosome complex component RRP42